MQGHPKAAVEEESQKEMKKNMRRLTLAATALAFLFSVGTASAAPIVFLYDSPANNGVPGPGAGTATGATPFTPGTAGTYTLTLWVDPTGATGGTTFGVNDNIILGNPGGSLTMTGFTAGPAASGVVANLVSPTNFQFNSGDAINGNTAPYEIGLLKVSYSGGPAAGDITLWSGDFLDSTFTQVNTTVPQTLISVAQVPEPGTLLLLGFGVGGIAVMIGRSRKS